MGSKSRSFLFDLPRFSLGDGQQSARDVITKVITRDALDFVGSEALYNGMTSADILFTLTSNLPTTAELQGPHAFETVPPVSPAPPVCTGNEVNA